MTILNFLGSSRIAGKVWEHHEARETRTSHGFRRIVRRLVHRVITALVRHGAPRTSVLQSEKVGTHSPTFKVQLCDLYALLRA